MRIAITLMRFFSSRCRNNFSFAFNRPTVAPFGSHGGVGGIRENDDFALGQVVFAAAVCINEHGLSQRVRFGGCRLAFFERKAVAIELIRHARDRELDTKKTFGFFDCGLDIWHIASGQNSMQWGGLLLDQFPLGTAT